jgi:hypothetical protein
MIPVNYYDDGDEDIDPSFIAFYYCKEYAPHDVKFGPDKVWLRNRKDFLELLNYWNKKCRTWKYWEAD